MVLMGQRQLKQRCKRRSRPFLPMVQQLHQRGHKPQFLSFTAVIMTHETSLN